VFFSHNKSANGIFSHDFSHNRSKRRYISKANVIMISLYFKLYPLRQDIIVIKRRPTIINLRQNHDDSTRYGVVIMSIKTWYKCHKQKTDDFELVIN
jgi:hypothetical protein